MTDLTQLPRTAEADGNLYAVTPDAALAARRLEDRARRSGVTRMTGLTGVQIGDGGTQNNVF
jgi:hypothetical protein